MRSRLMSGVIMMQLTTVVAGLYLLLAKTHPGDG